MNEIKRSLRSEFVLQINLGGGKSNSRKSARPGADAQPDPPSLPHRQHDEKCPPLPEEGVRATSETSTAEADYAEAERAAEAARAAHFERWRRAVIDAEVLKRPDWL